MNQKTLLSSFLPRILEEYEEKWKPAIPDSPRAERSHRRKRSLQKPLSSPSLGSACASYDESIGKSDDSYHPQAKEGDVSVVSDNAKIPTANLRQRSSSFHNSDDDDDKRELSASENDGDDDFGVPDQNRESVEDYGDIEELLSSSFPAVSRRRKIFVPRKPIDVAKNKIYKQQEHRSSRWSAGGSSLSTIERSLGATACVDNLPKQCTRRPSL